MSVPHPPSPTSVQATHKLLNDPALLKTLELDMEMAVVNPSSTTNNSNPLVTPPSDSAPYFTNVNDEKSLHVNPQVNLTVTQCLGTSETPSQLLKKTKASKRVRGILRVKGKKQKEPAPPPLAKGILKKGQGDPHPDNIQFNEQVQVLPTFKKSDYPRKPDNTATFRNLTPVLKISIREELNTYKATEMIVAPESQGNTCFH